MSNLLSDARLALRLLARSPGFAATLLGVLAVGIGATTAMFSIVNSLLLRPLPYAEGDRLTMLWCSKPALEPSSASVPDFLDWKAQGTSFEYVAATDYDAISLSSEGAIPENLPGAAVSGDFFPMLGVHAAAGRLLGPEDDRIDGPKIAVLSAAVWRRRFGADPGLVGRSVRLNSEPYTVVGIAPDGFLFSGPNSDRCDVWVPLANRKDYVTESASGRGDRFLHVLGRRKAGVSIADAQAQLSAVAKRISEAYPDTNTGIGVELQDLKEAMVGPSRQSAWILFAAVGLVFLVVCANVASLLLTRASARRGEMATRAALGGTRGRLIAQIVTETVVIFLLASGLGAGLAYWLVGLLAPGLLQTGGAFTLEVRVDALALAFCVLTSTLCGLVFGLIPAMVVLKVEPQAVLKESAAQAGVSKSQRRVRGALVVAQVALAFTLLAGSGLALRAFSRIASTPPGFNPENLATARLVLHDAKYKDDAANLAFYQQLFAKVAATPGVEAVAGNSGLPMSGSTWSGSFQIEGRKPWAPGERPTLVRNVVTPGYFRALGIPILRGREFTETDLAESRLVTVISQAAAERLFPGQDPLGMRIDWGDVGAENEHHWREIVGIAGDVRRKGLSRPVVAESYAPMSQHPMAWMALAVRSKNAEAFLQELPKIVQSVDPEQAVGSRRLMQDRVSDSVGPQRFTAMLLAAFAAVALILATIGVFGLVSYSTGQRTREIGVRMALGADPLEVLRLVMGEGLRLLGLGLVFGAIGAALVGQRLGDWMPEVPAFDPLVYLAIVAALAITGALASLLPAWRAVRIPPSVALRYE